MESLASREEELAPVPNRIARIHHSFFHKNGVVPFGVKDDPPTLVVAVCDGEQGVALRRAQHLLQHGHREEARVEGAVPGIPERLQGGAGKGGRHRRRRGLRRDGADGDRPGDTERPRPARRRGERAAHHQAGQPALLHRREGQGERHTHPAAGEGPAGALQDRRTPLRHVQAAEAGAERHRVEDQGHGGPRRCGEEAPPGRKDQGAGQREGHRRPRLDHTVRLRGAGGHAPPRQGGGPHRPRLDGHDRRAAGKGRLPHHEAAGRLPRHRPDRQRQDDDPLRSPQLHQYAGKEYLDRGRPGGVHSPGYRPNTGQPEDSARFCKRPSGRSCGRTRTLSW